MAHGHEHGGHGGHGGSAVHGPDYVPVPAIHPAGASDSASHHGHTIVAASTLMVVLLALVGLTLLTVGAALVEAWIVETFHVQAEIATFINVTICLAIAAIKTTLVVLFFMQLKYDNPVNAMIFIFCLATVATFLGFTMLDLGNRGTIDRFKAEQVTPGGTGIVTPTFKAAQDANPIARPITALARDAAFLNKTYDRKHAHGHGGDHPERSGPDRSRPQKGVPDDEAHEEHH